MMNRISNDAHSPDGSGMRPPRYPSGFGAYSEQQEINDTLMYQMPNASNPLLLFENEQCLVNEKKLG